MATVDIWYRPDMISQFNIFDFYNSDFSITSATSNEIAGQSGSYTVILRGNFSYGSDVSGTMTELDVLYNGQDVFDISGVNISMYYIEYGSTAGFAPMLFEGDDNFVVNTTTDVTVDSTIDGYAGYNTVTLPLPYSHYRISPTGEDVRITSGAYTATLHNIQKVYFPDVSYDVVARATSPFEDIRTNLPGDFNGDGKTDVLWRQTTGATFVWGMDGASIATAGAPPAVDPGWSIAATADFDRDGKSDILWRNTTTGAVNLWTMNGSTVAGNSYLGTVGNDWTIQGVGDFAGDGGSDVLWRDTSGAVVFWSMTGTQLGATLSVGSVDPGWAISGIGDFNGDGKSDILWRNGSSGAVNLWTMNGSDIVSNDYIATVSQDWSIQFLADFNGDGKTDVLWRQDGGAADLWTMAGASIASNDFIAAVNPDWKIAGAGDYTGDGSADLLWRQASTGAVNLWTMHGSQIAANSYVNTVDNSWAIQHV